MSAGPRVADIEEEENNYAVRIRLTKNEYYATIRNKLESNRFSTIRRHLEDQNDLKSCKYRNFIHELRKQGNENKKAVCKVDDFIRRRNVRDRTFSASNEKRRFFLFIQVQSATVQTRKAQSSFSGYNDHRSTSRAKSASTLSRPYTAPLQPFYDFVNDQDETDSDDEALPLTFSRATSAKALNTRPTSVVSTSTTIHSIQQQTAAAPTPTTQNEPSNTENPTNLTTRVNWSVKMRVFSLPDEDQFRKEVLAWKAEQRKQRARPVQQAFVDVELERKYQESIRRRQEIEAVITPELVQQYKNNDPVFAKRYRQLKLAFRSGKVPNYDPHDLLINGKLSKTNVERAKSALVTSHQKKIQNFYRTQQNQTDIQLSKRIESFLEKLAKMKEDQV